MSLHVFHFCVGRSQIEWKLKVKTDISVFPWANIGKNDPIVLPYFPIFVEKSVVGSLSVW